MKAKGLTATRTATTEVAAATAVNEVKIANPKSYIQTWERCPSRLTAKENKHWPVTYPMIGRTRSLAHCKMPDCQRQSRTYCRQCDVALCIEDCGGKNCFEKFHTKILFDADEVSDADGESSSEDEGNSGEEPI